MALSNLLPDGLLDATDRVDESLWFLPVALTLGTAAASLALLAIDHWFGLQIEAWLPFLALDSAAAVQATLGTIASSIITLTGVVFSITLVALTLASQQFGPRLLRTFVKDRATQLVLGTFVATFLHAMIVRHALNWSPEQIPRLSVHSAVLLAGIDALMLVYFIHHVARSIHVGTVVSRVAAEFGHRIALLPPADDEAGPPTPRTSLPAAEHPVEVRAENDGYVRVVDYDSLVALAQAADLQIEVSSLAGGFVLQRSVLARVHARGELDEGKLQRIRNAFALGDRRTTVQDLGFSIDQLVELALRALSPGINDPETAIACIDRLGQGLAQLARRRLPGGHHFDADGRLRVTEAATRFDQLIARCFDRIRRACSDHLEVGAAITSSLQRAADVTTHQAPRRALEDYRDALSTD